MNSQWELIGRPQPEDAARAVQPGLPPAMLGRAPDAIGPSQVPPREAIERWGDALALGDRAEVDRLVAKSRADRVEIANHGWLGAMLGVADHPSDV